MTGGAGFIGSHLVDRLLRDGWRVRVLDNFDTGSWGNLRGARPDIEVIVGDVRDLDTCQGACRSVDSVFHLAAIASVASSVEEPLLSHSVTLGGTLNMLLASRDASVRRFIFSSSAAVYGNAETLPTVETQPLMPQSPYASAKASGEFYCSNACGLYGLETVVLRYFNVFGPRQSANSGYAAVIPRFIQAALTRGVPHVYGDGLQTRDFVFVENVVAANVLAAEATAAAGQTFNVASGVETSLLDMLHALGHEIGEPLHAVFEPARPADIRHSRADIGRARHLLKYEATVSLCDGLVRTLDAAAGCQFEDADLVAAHDKTDSPARV